MPSAGKIEKDLSEFEKLLEESIEWMREEEERSTDTAEQKELEKITDLVTKLLEAVEMIGTGIEDGAASEIEEGLGRLAEVEAKLAEKDIEYARWLEKNIEFLEKEGSEKAREKKEVLKEDKEVFEEIIVESGRLVEEIGGIETVSDQEVKEVEQEMDQILEKLEAV